jgi:SAM-dependent methyltransferase
LNTVASTFDSAAIAYEQQLSLGISLSGESADYFVQGRIRILGNLLDRFAFPAPGSIVDFGCGVGNAVEPLLNRFATATLTGIDCSSQSLSVARNRFSNQALLAGRLQWENEIEDSLKASVDLVYTSGVFHHIPPAERQSALANIYQCLRPNGVFALFENNPWNPGTKWVMSRIPFDRDAVCLSPIEARCRLEDAGFKILAQRFCFYFPRCLSLFRPIEACLTRLPLGAQYVTLAKRP